MAKYFKLINGEFVLSEIETYGERLVKDTEKENIRVTKEWEIHMQKFKCLSSTIANIEAVAIAERQSVRSKRIVDKYFAHFKRPA